MKWEKPIIILIRELENQIERQSNNSMKSMDITMSQAAVLAAVLESPDKQLTMKELEKRVHLSQSVTAGIVSRMEQKQYLESFGNPDDKRIKMIRVTEQGEKQCNEARKILVKIERQITDGLTEKEKTSLEELLTKAIENMMI